MEARLFPAGTVPEFCTPAWYLDRPHAPHVDEAVHRPRLERAVAFVARALDSGADSVVDLGAGDGGLLSLLPPGVRRWGYDLCPANVAAAAQRGVDVRLVDVLDGDVEWGDVAMATEVLEHLADPHGFLVEVRRRCSWLVASSPADETSESHYAFHAWIWDVDGYAALVEGAGWSIVAHETVGPFQVVLGVAG
jgi:trans-aconitate methyltransferase